MLHADAFNHLELLTKTVISYHKAVGFEVRHPLLKVCCQRSAKVSEGRG